TLSEQPKLAFHRLDVDHNHRLARDEVPEHLLSRYDALVDGSSIPVGDGLTKTQFHYTLALPATLLDYVWAAAGEFGLGLVLGLGVLTILSGMQLAGETIDQQTGTAIGEIANPALDINGSVTGQFLFMFAVTVLILMEPTGYHLILMSALVQTFQTIPVGDAFVSTSAIELLRDLVHESLILGVQVAAPILATMSLVGLTMGFLGHTVPQVNVLVVGFPVRAIINLLILAVTLSGAAELIIDIVPGVIDRMFHALALV
ncbi:MAG: flagellar biosynthetic protein FliR, partial [Phycisphaerae bacterium]